VDENGDARKNSTSSQKQKNKLFLNSKNANLPPILKAAIIFISEYLFHLPTLQQAKTKLYQARVLSHRAILALLKRRRLVFSSCFLYIIMALGFGIIVGDCDNGSDSLHNVVAFFATGSILLLFTNVQFVYFQFNNQKVF
jgi:hypothetical protein